MAHGLAIVLCLVFSGLTALVYQILWTRYLGFAFGTTTEAIGTVLAIFFGGLALGNLVAARHLVRLRRPLCVYALLEAAIGAFALLSLPLLRNLDAWVAWMGASHAPGALHLLRVATASAILLPPTAAMGATLPVVARALVSEDATVGRWSAVLYAANTLGAVCGAYLCGFWLIPHWGLARSLTAAGAVNLAVAAAAAAVAARAGRADRALPSAVPERKRVAPRVADAPGSGSARPFLVFFAISGFVAIGYEIVWSKVFGIVMEGTLYGFATVLSSYLLGIGLGSLGMAPLVDRIRDLPRAFALLHVAIAACVALGMTAVPYLPYAYGRLAELAPGSDAAHLLFLLAAPIVLLPTALFGAAFPLLIRIYTGRAQAAGRGMGIATAVNTAGGIAGSLLVGFWWIPHLGMDASLYGLILIDLAVALLALAPFQSSGGLARVRALAGSTAVLFAVALAFDGVHVERAIAGRQIRAADLGGYRRDLARATASLVLAIEGKSAIVTVDDLPTSRLLRTNGLPEAGFNYGPPHYPLEAVLLGLLPYLTADAPERALVIGLGGGNTLNALLHTPMASIDVIELEPAVVDALEILYRGRASPLESPRVTLRINDGRHELLLGRRVDGPRYNLIASQPSHPWRIGAANLFTEEFFRLARANLSEGGRFALWVNGFRTDAETLLAVIASFERVFEGSLLIDIGGSRPRHAFLLLGGRQPIALDPKVMRPRMAQPSVAELLEPYGLRTLEELLARLEGPGAAFAALAPEAANTDDNAFVETRVPRQLTWPMVDFAKLEAQLAPEAPVLPPLRSALDVGAIARTLLRGAEGGHEWPQAAKLERLVRRHGEAIGAPERDVLLAAARLADPAREVQALAMLRALAETHRAHPEPLRVLGRHLAIRRAQPAEASEAFAQAFARSGSPEDAYDAGRALHSLDRSAAWRWFARIPEGERSHFPRLAFYEAQRALDRGLRGEALRPLYEALRRYRDTAEGRMWPGVNELLSRMAYAVGNPTAARGFADAARAERERSGKPALARAAAALEQGRIDAAADALEQAARWLPADARLNRLRSQLALARDDAAALEEALRDLRGWAPSVRAGIAAENRFRSEQGLPLRSETERGSWHPGRPAS